MSHTLRIETNNNCFSKPIFKVLILNFNIIMSYNEFKDFKINT